MRFLSDGIWKQITASVARARKTCRVAVPYFGKDGHKMLPLERGSILVVDMSPGAVKSGQTHPLSVLSLVKKGVEVYSVRNLHAKVVVAGDVAFIGSMNASRHSSETLIEAVVLIREKDLIREASLFVEGLVGEPVSPEYARQMQKSYRPPVWDGSSRKALPDQPTAKPRGPGSRPRPAAPIPLHSPLWLVPLEELEHLSPEEKDAQRRGRRRARALLSSKSDYEVDSFFWNRKQFISQLKPHDLVMQVVDTDSGKKRILPPSRVLTCERFEQDGLEQAVVLLERPKTAHDKSPRGIIHRHPKLASTFDRLNRPKKIKDPQQVHSLLSLWRWIRKPKVEA